jgi:4-hydroxybenzoate polyprenyltransferase
MRNMMRTLLLFIKTLRPYQWIKNIFIFAPMVFALQFVQVSFIKTSILAFILFSLVAGSIYVLNDCFDVKRDRLHPDKKKRPIASGALSVKAAAPMAAILLLLTLTVIFLMNIKFFYIALFYIGMNIVYSSFLKQVVILDVMIIAVGFVLRVQIGGVINDIPLSTWILVITFLLAIFLGLVKRRQELLKVNAIQDDTGTKVETRKTLKLYNLQLLDQLISITTATTLISYIVYVVNPDIQAKFHTRELYLTVPFVIFGIFRYLYLTYAKDKGENPAEVIFSDLPFAVNGLLWVLVFVLLIFYN